LKTDCKTKCQRLSSSLRQQVSKSGYSRETRSRLLRISVTLAAYWTMKWNNGKSWILTWKKLRLQYRKLKMI